MFEVDRRLKEMLRGVRGDPAEGKLGAGCESWSTDELLLHYLSPVSPVI